MHFKEADMHVDGLVTNSSTNSKSERSLDTNKYLKKFACLTLFVLKTAYICSKLSDL